MEHLDSSKLLKIKWNIPPLQHNIPPTEPFNADMKIARYFTYEKLNKMINIPGIWFSNSKNLSDNLERALPKKYLERFELNDTAEAYSKISKFKNLYISSYISCWTEYTNENYALWEIYDPQKNGACLITTIGKLLEQFEKSFVVNDYIVTSKVEYINDNTKAEPNSIFLSDENESDYAPIHINLSEKYKIEPYEYEKEIRFICYSKLNKPGFLFETDKINDWVDEVIFNPFYSNARNLLINYIDEEKIKKSIINETNK